MAAVSGGGGGGSASMRGRIHLPNLAAHTCAVPTRVTIGHLLRAEDAIYITQLSQDIGGGFH